MPITASLHYAGQEDEKVLPLWLNKARGSKSYERIQELMRQISAVATIGNRNWSIMRQPKGRLKELGPAQQELGAASLALQQLLKHYRYAAHLFFEGPNSFHLSSVAPTQSGEYVLEYRRHTTGVFRKVQVKISESDIVLALCRMAESRRLERLRQCRNKDCTRWIFATRKHQRFCLDKPCRRKWQDWQLKNNPKRKAKRAEYMRDYRANPIVKKRA